jgi:hypothetical protein
VSITSPIITGGTLQTSASTNVDRIIISGANNDIEFWSAANELAATLSTFYTSTPSPTSGSTLEDVHGNYVSVSGRGSMGFSGFGTAYGNLYLTWDANDSGTTRLECDVPFNFALLPYGTQSIGATGNRWDDLFLGGDIIITGTVDGVDVSAHAGNASAHHSSTSNGLDITPASVVSGGIIRPSTSNSYDLGSTSYYWDDVYANYIKLNSSYGQIHWGSTVVLDFYSGYAIYQGHLYPYATNTYDLGTATNGYWRYLYVQSVMASSRLNLTAKSSHTYAAGDIINWASGATDQFRGRPGDGTWDGSFDMTAI